MFDAFLLNVDQILFRFEEFVHFGLLFPQLFFHLDESNKICVKLIQVFDGEIVFYLPVYYASHLEIVVLLLLLEFVFDQILFCLLFF